MFRLTRRSQWTLRTLAAIFGAGLLTYLVRRVGLEKVVEDVLRLGWGLGLVIALGGASHLVRTWAWRLALTDWSNEVPFSRILQLRLASEAAGQAGAFGQLFGEGLRISALSPTIPIDCCISSVALDRSLFIATGAMVSIAGIVAALLVVSLTHTLRLYAMLFAVILISLLFGVALAILKRWPILSRSARTLRRWRWMSDRVGNAQPLIKSVENKLFDFHRNTPGAFWASLILNLVGQGMAVLEVYLILWLLGAKVGPLGAFVLEALTKMVNVVGTFNPGNIGTYEGGNMLIAKIFGLSGGIGLAVAVTRRLRAIFWAAVGGLCLVVLSKSIVHTDSDNRTPVDSVRRRGSGESGQASQSFTAVIFANRFQEVGGTGSPRLRVGTLPILLRDILAVQRAGARRIIVCADSVTGFGLQRELLDTGRLPHCVEWIETYSKTELPHLLRQITSEGGVDRLMLIAGNSTYHSSVIRRASEWNGRGALALTSGDQLAGIYVLSADAVLSLAERRPCRLRSLEQVHAWLILSDSVHCEPVPEEMWQRVLTHEDLISAERKLDQWLVKPTDGIFARMNRRISVPISRQIIKLPITPNAVSLFTLGVGFAAGLLLARGGYWNMLLGAVLSVSASILDGCDGEVARLKLMESDFGCWLETVCDYLYYLFIFVGITIGLWRNSETKTYLVWGGLLLLGAITSFLVAGFGRHRLANGRPEQYLRIWQAKAESRRSNPILYIGRHTEFLIRRCFLPYALLFFAALNITRVALVLSAVGANLVWLISLYSYRTFVGSRRSPVKDCAASI
jgi:phosphatidylglycerophosphate synthase